MPLVATKWWLSCCWPTARNAAHLRGPPGRAQLGALRLVPRSWKARPGAPSRGPGPPGGPSCQCEARGRGPGHKFAAGSAASAKLTLKGGARVLQPGLLPCPWPSVVPAPWHLCQCCRSGWQVPKQAENGSNGGPPSPAKRWLPEAHGSLLVNHRSVRLSAPNDDRATLAE